MIGRVLVLWVLLTPFACVRYASNNTPTDDVWTLSDASYTVQDVASDSARSDSAAPDSAVPDSAVPDSAAPDSAVPDSAAPDSAAPDSTSLEHIIFATSTLHTGSFGGPAGADAICLARAKSAGRGGAWKAIISDATVDARDRVSIVKPIRSTSGQLVAQSASDLWDGVIANPVGHDEAGTPITSPVRVWDGTRDNGTKYPNPQSHCNGWSTTDPTYWGEYGRLDSTTLWIDDQAQSCNKDARLYCISQ
jgi:hypothetical protein